ncbi:MAG: RiPP maturation radical SAM C-methyltransferase, partial [Chloroflexi bacterium]|nr:RiPP maturation radical SAM C-methyltransferase [Chloroflexota bacterium]
MSSASGSGMDPVNLEHSRQAGIPYSVALVYPPFGPSGLPSLGLALLSAGIKARGHVCRTWYWNYDLIARMPGASFDQRLAAYQVLTNRTWHPFNEWVFAGSVYGRKQAERDAAAVQELLRLEAMIAGGPIRAVDLLRLRREAQQIVDTMTDRLEPFDVVGIATTFYQNLPALALARRIKERWPGKVVVLGGANCDGEMGEGLMRLFDSIDFAFSGEVDFAFPDFVDRLSRSAALDDVPGLLRRVPDGEIIAGPKALPLQNLDALPYPDFDDYVAERHRAGFDVTRDLVLALESSRGCWWGEKQHCTFCGLNAMGIGYRWKSQERFRAEVTQVLKRYHTRFLFMTDNILAMEYYDDFMRWAMDADLQVDFFYEIKANVKRWHVERLA